MVMVLVLVYRLISEYLRVLKKFYTLKRIDLSRRI